MSTLMDQLYTRHAYPSELVLQWDNEEGTQQGSCEEYEKHLQTLSHEELQSLLDKMPG